MSSYPEILTKISAKSAEFAKFLADINHLNNDIKDRTDKLLKAINDLQGKGSKLCTVCYTRERSHTILKCGHLFCSNCAERALARNKCFTCRQEIEGLFRVFI